MNNKFSLKQNIDNKKDEIGIDLNYTLNLGKRGLSFFSKTNNLNESFESTSTFDNIYNNTLNSKSFRSYNGVEFYTPLSKIISLSINGGYVFNTYGLNNTSFNNDYFEGNVLSRLVFSNNKVVEFSFNHTNNITSLDNVLENPFVIDYRNIQTNGDLLINTFVPTNQFRLQFFKFNPSKESSLIFNSRYSFTDKTINTNNRNNNAFTNQVLSLNGEERNLYTSFFYKHKFEFIPLIASYSISYEHKENVFFEDQGENDLVVNRLSGFFAFNSNFKNTTLLLNFGANYSLTEFADINTKTNQYFFQYFLKTSYELIENLDTSFNTIISDYIANNDRRTVYSLNPEIRYSLPKSNWEIKLEGNNILNIKNNEIITSTVQQNYSEERITSILNGSIVLSGKYRF